MSDSDQKMAQARPKVVRRKESFAKNISTKIWLEKPTRENPYIAESCYCHGYDLLSLMSKRSYVDVLFLIIKGELPSVEESQLLEKLMIGFINPGPRHPATRAAMNTGVGKTDPSHILPISLSILGGEHLGGAEVEASMRWLRKQSRHDPQQRAQQLLAEIDKSTLGDQHIAPGFGTRFGGIDAVPQKIAQMLADLPGAGKVLHWANEFAETLQAQGQGWLATGVVAATFCDLGIQPRLASGLFQILNAPGLLAHGAEMASKALSDMPFPDDADYFIERESIEWEGIERESIEEEVNKNDDN